MVAAANGRSTARNRAAWHKLQQWLASGRADVDVPFALDLAGLVPPVAVRLRRDFPMVLALIRAHALLHQLNRERGSEGQVVATLADYAAVRELVADLMADAVDRTVSATIRETVAAVASLAVIGETTGIAVAHSLGLDKSAASRRVRVAVERGYVRNLEDRRGHPARLVLGDPLPTDTAILPEPDVLEGLHGCTATDGHIWRRNDGADR
jgi:hypothetical protein